MGGRSNHLFTLVLGLAVLLCACGSPEKELEKAKATRSRAELEEFVRKYRESDLAKKAQHHLQDISAWEGAEAQASVDKYSQYQRDFPNGLFSTEAIQRIEELTILNRARQEDVVSAYEAYLREWPQGVFRDEAQKRVIELRPAAELYETFKAETSLDTLRAALESLQGTGYQKLLQHRIEIQAISQAEAKVLKQKRYQGLPGTLDGLYSYVDQEGTPSSKMLAKQAIEELLIAAIDMVGPGSRFVLPNVELLPEYMPDRFSVRIEGGSEVHFTQFPDDKMTLTVDLGFGKAKMLTTGEVAFPVSKTFTVGYGGVVRFSGKVPIQPDYLVKGDQNDPISFYIKKGVGPVYLHGKGTVEKEGTVVVSFPEIFHVKK